MLAIALLGLLAAPADDLAQKLRHLDSAGSAGAPQSSPDGSRIAFVTSLFGTRQAASMAEGGGYPNQLTDEPGGVLGVRYLPNDSEKLIAIALRADKRRLLFVDENGTPPVEVDPAPGDQYPGGFSRDGRKFFYAIVEGGKASLRQMPLETRKPAPVEPPPPAAGLAPPVKDSLSLDEALAGLFALGPAAPDGRSILALVKRGENEALVSIEISTARGQLLAPAEGRFRMPHFSHDGRTVYVLTDAGRKTMGVDSIALAGHARKTVYAPSQEIEAYAISEDDHRLAVAAEAEGETLFSLLDLPGLRVQPLAAPPGGALAPVASGEAPLLWAHGGDRLLFGWRLSDDTTDVWSLRLGYGTPVRLTRSPRPGLPRDVIPRPALVHAAVADGRELSGWLWRPADTAKPRVAVLISSSETRPVFDKRIAALNFAGLAVLAVNGPGAQAAALAWLHGATDLDASQPLLLNPDGLAVESAPSWSGVVKHGELDPDHPDLAALAKYAHRPL